jgi:hypothetical protein
MDTPQENNKKVSPVEELGLTGLKRSGGFVIEEFLTALRGDRAVKVYREMTDNDPVVGAILFAIDKLIRQVDWYVDPPKDANEDDERTVFLKECMDDMSHSWPDFISEVVTMLPFGWSYFEIVYKKRQGPQTDGSKSNFTDGKIGWRKFAIRSQDSLLMWDFDKSGGINGMTQVAPPTHQPVFIPIEKSLLFRTSTNKGNPEGRSVLRNAYRPWYFKKRIEEIEAIGVERDLAGFPVLYMDPRYMAADATPEMKAAYAEYQKMIRNIRRDEQEGAILPTVHDPQTGAQLIKLELVSSGGSRSFDTGGIIDRYNRNIAMTVLADFILLGSTATGSFALSADKTDLFAVALGAWLQSIAATLNTHAVPRLLKLNGMSVENMPQIKFGDIEEQPLAEVVQALSTLSGMGMPVFPNEELQERLYERMNLPMSDEAEVAEAKMPPKEEKPEPKPLEEGEDDGEDIDAEQEKE